MRRQMSAARLRYILSRAFDTDAAARSLDAHAPLPICHAAVIVCVCLRLIRLPDAMRGLLHAPLLPLPRYH